MEFYGLLGLREFVIFGMECEVFNQIKSNLSQFNVEVTLLAVGRFIESNIFKNFREKKLKANFSEIFLRLFREFFEAFLRIFKDYC